MQRSNQRDENSRLRAATVVQNTCPPVILFLERSVVVSSKPAQQPWQTAALAQIATQRTVRSHMCPFAYDRRMARILLRLYLSPDRPLGPGKVKILESIRESGSISEAARAMKMSYRSAWLLVDSMNTLFRNPVVRTTLGGRGGGSAILTDFGAEVVTRYRSMERATQQAVAGDLSVLERNLRSTHRPKPRKRTTRA